MSSFRQFREATCLKKSKSRASLQESAPHPHAHSHPHTRPGHPPTMSRKVFAHYMLGLTDNQSAQQWRREMQTAKACGIDGFALNIGPSDSWTQTQVRNAYKVAAHLGGFVVFLSFDMAAGSWSVSQVVGLINEFKNERPQFKVDGRPFVSTFEGPGWANNWRQVRGQTGDIFLVPDWSSLGASGVGCSLGMIDGAFSWVAWPQPGQHKMSTGEDVAYKKNLRGKKYMMGVSPWFFTNLPQWNKNWYSSSESLWYDRWEQVFQVQPDFVEIITWNDFGESSYICDTVPQQIVHGAQAYVNGHDHGAFRALLPYYIAAFKAGGRHAQHNGAGGSKAVAWYRTTPARAASDGNTRWGQGGGANAAQGAKDVISVVVVAQGQRAEVEVAIGGQHVETLCTQPGKAISYFEVPFHDKTGLVSISMNGKTSQGLPIENGCRAGHVNFNCTSIVVE